MIIDRLNRGLLTALSFLLVILCGSSLAAPVKIKVISENAAVRLRPDPGSEAVVQKVAVGMVYESAGKTGEWYEIRHQSDIGVMITGYIHEKDVEVMKEVLETILAERGAKRRAVEMAFGGGMVGGSFLDGTSAYSTTWSNNLLKSVNESGTVALAAKKPASVGFSLTYFLSENLGIGLRVDYNLAQKISGQSDFSLNWEFTSGTKGSVADQWNATGDLSVWPVSLNLVYKIGGGGMFHPYLGAGVSYFMGSVKANSTMGYAITFVDAGYQYIDYVDLPLRLDKSLNAVGFNLGGGLDVLFAKSVGLNIDLAYFLGKKSEFNWTVLPGTYVGNFNAAKSWSFSDAFLAQNIDPIPAPKIGLSFFKIQAGLKILL